MQFMEFVYLAASVEPMISPSMIQCESPIPEPKTGFGSRLWIVPIPRQSMSASQLHGLRTLKRPHNYRVVPLTVSPRELIRMNMSIDFVFLVSEKNDRCVSAIKRQQLGHHAS